MSTSFTSNQIHQFKRDARRAKRSKGTTIGFELDAIAQKHGIANWSLLERGNSEHSTQIVVPGVRFARTPEEMRIAMLKPSNWDYFDDRNAETVRARLEDLSRQFKSSNEAIDFAVAYMQCMLQLPRFHLHAAAEAYFEMRCWLPYCVQEDAADPAYRILVGRDYKPVGMVQKEERVEYKDYPNLQVRISDSELETLSPSVEPKVSSYLYDISPWSTRTAARKYLARLQALQRWLAGHRR